MLRECETHRYFRGETCPVCKQPGKFLMNQEELDRLGRIMAGALRHFPERFGLTMDEHGWVPLRVFVNQVKRRKEQFYWLRPHHVIAIIETDPKGRYQYDGEMIRATYGHSINIELDLPSDNIPDFLYYPSRSDEVEKMLKEGISPSERQHVHLSLSPKDAWNAGTPKIKEPAILEIDTRKVVGENMKIMKAGKTVFITKQVPAAALRLMDRDTLEEYGIDFNAAPEQETDE
ncbi:MAG: RNA 2'-phosphotransferase [Thermoplasmata archaeon]